MITFTSIFAYLWCENEKKIKSIVCDNKSIKIKSLLFMILTFMPMFWVNSLMKYVGNDYSNYYTYYQNIISGRGQDVEYTYKAICLLVSKLGLGFQGVYVVYSLISYTLLLACIRKYSKNYAVSYLMFFFSGYFGLLGLNQIRQFVCVGLVYFAYGYIKEKKCLKYCICILIASTFHFTAIIMLPFYWILQKEWRLSVYAVIAAILLPFNFFGPQIKTWLFATFLPRYLNTDYVTREFEIDIPYWCVIIVTLFICLLYKWRDRENGPIFQNCIMMASTIVLFGSWIPEFRRFVYYFFIVSIGYVTELVEKDNNKKKRLFIYSIILATYAWYYIRTSNNWGIYPYKSVLG